MSIEQMRTSISNVYDSLRWKNRVKRMADNQVVAIYHSFERGGKFNQKSLSRESFHQMNLFELGMEEGEIVHG